MANHINGWFKPSSSAQRLLIRSEAYELLTHYIASVGSARCQMAGCELCCQVGEPKRTLVHVVERAGALFLLELGDDALEKPLVVGDQIVISKRKLGDFVETFIRRDGFEPAGRVWPANYLAAIGQRTYEKAVRSERLDDYAI